jgi:hypothetical protein
MFRDKGIIMQRKSGWAMTAGAVVGLLIVYTVATISSIAGGGVTPFEVAFSRVWFWALIVFGAPSAAIGVGLLFSFFHILGVIRLSTLLGFAGGAIGGFLFGLLIPTVFGSELDAIILILWEWIWTGLGGIVGRLIEYFTKGFD